MSTETLGGRQYPPTPELDKQSAAIKDGSVRIGEFLDWLSERGLTLCRFDERVERWHPAHEGSHNLLAAFYDIDLVKIDAERQAILAAIRGELPKGIKIKELEERL